MFCLNVVSEAREVFRGPVDNLIRIISLLALLQQPQPRRTEDDLLAEIAAFSLLLSGDVLPVSSRSSRSNNDNPPQFLPVEGDDPPVEPGQVPPPYPQPLPLAEDPAVDLNEPDPIAGHRQPIRNIGHDLVAEHLLFNPDLDRLVELVPLTKIPCRACEMAADDREA